MSRNSILSERNKWLLPFGFLAGPVLWGLQILAGYGFASLSCRMANKWPVHFLLALSALIVLAAAVSMYRARSPRRRDLLPAATGRAQESTIFWVNSSFGLSLLFFLLILATAIAALFLSPCPIITMPVP